MIKENLNTLYYDTDKFENDSLYLDYTWSINWNVKNIINTSCKDGYIVQKVKIIDTTKISRNVHYYEAWKVEEAKYIEHSEELPDDSFSNQAIVESIGKKGKIEYFSEIYWVSKDDALYKLIDSWEKNKVVESNSSLKSEYYSECPYLWNLSFIYKREKFTHIVNFTDNDIIKKSIKAYFIKRKNYKQEEFFSHLIEELEDRPRYIGIVEQIREEWKE